MTRVLLACEESQAVTIAMRRLGIEAYSCDIQPCSGGHPEWHIQGDVLPLLEEHWDLIIAFPPCTHLSVSGARWWPEKRTDGRQQAAIEFFLKFAHAQCQYIAIENTPGIMTSVWRKPDQMVRPWMFGDSHQKSVCLWLKNLPPLRPTNIVDRGEFLSLSSGGRMSKWYTDAARLPPSERSKVRSKTFPGIAQAMAEQWGMFVHERLTCARDRIGAS